MRRVRVIPTLLISRDRGGLVKGVRFKRHVYVGDPINAVKVFNDKEVDEIAVIDIDATREKRPPDLAWIQEICSEAFMPLAYGGGITRAEQVTEVLRCGAEKVLINTTAATSPHVLEAAAKRVGSQSVVAAIDVKKVMLRGNRAMIACGSKDTGRDPVTLAKQCERAGAGEILLTSVDREGTRDGYDVELIRAVAKAVHIPVVANGGAGKVSDFAAAVRAGASAVAAGTMFVFIGSQRGVLINYPSPKELHQFFEEVSR